MRNLLYFIVISLISLLSMTPKIGPCFPCPQFLSDALKDHIKNYHEILPVSCINEGKTLPWRPKKDIEDFK